MTLLHYLILINLFTFGVRGLDKRKAKKGWWRISEKQLLKLCIAGGIVGGLLGITFRRHKTLKGNFLRKMYGICIMRIIITVMYLIGYPGV